jgi:hypothetical protein
VSLRSIRRRIASVVAAIVIMASISLGVAAPSQAATSYCGDGRCTVYLNWTETVNLSNGRPPKVVTPFPQLTLAINAGLWGHVLIAKGWVWRGYCVAFTADVRPWASQGMMGWRC